MSNDRRPALLLKALEALNTEPSFRYGISDS